MASMSVVVVLVIAGVMLISAFVMSIVGLTKTPSASTNEKLTTPILIHPGTANPGPAPTAVSSAGIGFTLVSIDAGSTDTSGSVSAAVNSSGAGQIAVTFGTPFVVPPKSIQITSHIGIIYSTPLTVSSLTSTSFVVDGQASLASGVGIMFYYLVL